MAIELRDWLGSYGPDDETERMLEVWEEVKSRRPTTSLARRDAEVAHSVLRNAAAKAPPEAKVWLNALAEDYRRQAEGVRNGD